MKDVAPRDINKTPHSIFFRTEPENDLDSKFGMNLLFQGEKNFQVNHVKLQGCTLNNQGFHHHFPTPSRPIRVHLRTIVTVVTHGHPTEVFPRMGCITETGCSFV